MFKSEKDKEQFLSQIANKLAASTHQLSEAARRLQLAELTYREYLLRLRKLDEQMRSLIDILHGAKTNRPVQETNPAFCQPPQSNPQPRKKKLRYADYIEFSNYAELRKFEQMDEITEEDLKGCDADTLMKKLLEDDTTKV